jgi:hypothetical protein
MCAHQKVVFVVWHKEYEGEGEGEGVKRSWKKRLPRSLTIRSTPLYL